MRSFKRTTPVQWRPTGQYWKRHIPSRTALSEAIGIQIVVNTWPALQRTGRSKASNILNNRGAYRLLAEHSPGLSDVRVSCSVSVPLQIQFEVPPNLNAVGQKQVSLHLAC